MSDEIALHAMLGLDFDRPDHPDWDAEVRMPIRFEAFGFSANLHGGAIATMIDLACAVAAVKTTDFDSERESLVTSDMHIRYLGRARGEAVFARAKVVRHGRQLAVVDCDVVDDDGHLVATADLAMMRVPHRRRPTEPDPTETDSADPEGAT